MRGRQRGAGSAGAAPPEDSAGVAPRGGKRHGDSAMVIAPWRCHSALITARGDGAGGDGSGGGSAGAAARRHQLGGGTAGGQRVGGTAGGTAEDAGVTAGVARR